jgi:hypothetical protein
MGKRRIKEVVRGRINCLVCVLVVPVDKGLDCDAAP